MNADSTSPNHSVVEAWVAEVEPDGGSRVRLRFPASGRAEPGGWCQVLGTAAEPFLALGDRVLAAFVQGDPDRAVVLGRLPGGENGTDAEAGEVGRRVIRSGHGHEVVLDDSSSSAAVTIRSAAGHVVDLDEEGSTLRIALAPGGAVTLAGKGDYEVTSSTKIFLKAPEVTVDSPAINLGGDATAQPLLLGQAMFAAFNAHTHATAGPGTPSPPVPLLTPAVFAKKARTA
ncbi:phage baseplate assembly protein V [Kitasatospora sp. NPDC091257]|uniref:phage baseplate assembly protein V n=1 Tax=Kitasatospora sp. NPDC091257 TaxID=3364084 RepID=UPI0037F4DF69